MFKAGRKGRSRQRRKLRVRTGRVEEGLLSRLATLGALPSLLLFINFVPLSGPLVVKKVSDGTVLDCRWDFMGWRVLTSRRTRWSADNDPTVGRKP